MNHPETPERWWARPTVSISATVAVLFVAGCSANSVRISEISGLINIVSDRHDSYVEADESLSDIERSVYMRSTRLLRELVSE